MRIAAVSSISKIGDVQKNLCTTISWLEKLHGIDFVLFPELNLSGYTKDASILKQIDAQKEKVFQQLLAISEKIKIAFAVGFPERIEEQFYISHFLFSQGKLVGTHRKTHLGSTERETFSEGEEMNVFTVGEMKIGMQLCYETHFPEVSYAQAKQGANILAMAFASPRENAGKKLERFKRFLPARAYDNACFLVACNQNFDAYCESEVCENPLNNQGESARKKLGLSLIIDPKGNIVQEAVSEEKEFVSTQCDLSEIERIKGSKMAWFNPNKREELISKYYNK